MKTAKKLHLVLKAEYFDEIEAGTKVEEFRRFNEYWIGRLVDPAAPSLLDGRKYDGIVLHRGYTARVLERPWKGFEIKKVKHKHFGPRAKTVFAIRVN